MDYLIELMMGRGRDTLTGSVEYFAEFGERQGVLRSDVIEYRPRGEVDDDVAHRRQRRVDPVLADGWMQYDKRTIDGASGGIARRGWVIRTSVMVKSRTSPMKRGRVMVMPMEVAWKKKLVTMAAHTGTDVRMSDHGMEVWHF